MTVWRDGVAVEERRHIHAPDGVRVDERIHGSSITRTEVDGVGRRILHATEYGADGVPGRMDAYTYLDGAAVPGPWLTAHAHAPAHRIPGATGYAHRCDG